MDKCTDGGHCGLGGFCSDCPLIKGTDMPELKPCPFCGNRAQLIQHSINDPLMRPRVDCRVCRAGFDYLDEEVLIRSWNTRSSQWVSVKDKRPEEEGKYLVNSSYGVTLAFYHTWTGSEIFQDAPEHCDEGMENMDGVVFKVTHWMQLPTCPENI